MSRETENFNEKLDEIIKQTENLLVELVDLRKNNSAIKAETAKIIENKLIYLSRYIKELSKKSNDDLSTGISFLKIKMMS